MKKRNAIKKWGLAFIVAGLIACGSAEDRKAKYLQQGKALFEEGRYEKAVLAFKNVLQIDPKDIESRYQLAETLSKQGEIRGAFSHYRSLVSTDETHVMSRVRVGQLFLMGRNIEDAEKMLQEALALAPGNNEVLVFQATINLVKNNFDDAVSNIEKVLQQDPNFASAILMRAAIFSKNGKTEQAVERLKQGIVNAPDNEEMRLMLAKLYYKQGLKTETEGEFNKLIGINPDSILHYKRLVEFYLLDKQIDKAENVLRMAVKQMPDDEKPQFLLIDFLARQYNVDKAIDELTVLIDKTPEAYGLHFKLASLQLEKKDLVASEATLKKIVELDRLGASGIKARNGLARLYASTKRVDQAQKLIAAVLKENPRDVQALTLRGQFAFADKDVNGAIADFRSALVGQPKNIELLKLLSSAQVVNNDIELAIENMQKVVSVAPKDVAARLQVVDLLFRSGKTLQAESDILEALELDPKNIKTLDYLFKIRMAQKEWAQAQDVSEKIRTLGEDPAKGYYLSGRAFQADKRWQKSIEAFKQVLAIKPGYVEPLTQMVKSYLLLEQSDNALTYLQDVVNNQKAHFVAYNLMGELYLRSKNLEKAEKAFRQVVEIKPEWHSGYRNLALLALINKDKATAIDTLKNGIEKTKGSIGLVDLLASIYKKDGNNHKIIALYEQAYLQHPNSIVVVNNLASFLSEYGETKDALDRAEKIAAPLEKSTNANLLDTVGWVAYKQGHYEKAKTILESAIALGGSVAEINYHMGMVYYQLGNSDSAQIFLKKALVDAPNYSGLEQAKDVLKKLQSKI